MDFSIITPSFRHSDWLQLCIASVADQEGVRFEHIVQDAGSDDGTLDWLRSDPRVQAFIEKDRGMYDAINRGLRRAKGELLAYINCDEQYLPGALAKVKSFFDDHPHVDFVFGDCIVIRPNGSYVCERRALVPRLAHSWVSNSLSFLTAATFFRRQALESAQLYFNPNFRAAGDADWTVRLVRSGKQMAGVPAFLSVFTETGSNLGLDQNAVREQKAFSLTAPAWARFLKPIIVASFRWRRWRAGYYHCQPHDYAIYTLENRSSRRLFHVSQPTFRWHRPVQTSQRTNEGSA